MLTLVSHSCSDVSVISSAAQLIGNTMCICLCISMLGSVECLSQHADQLPMR